jgi:hypothetical protein
MKRNVNKIFLYQLSKDWSALFFLKAVRHLPETILFFLNTLEPYEWTPFKYLGAPVLWVRRKCTGKEKTDLPEIFDSQNFKKVFV